MHEDFLTGIILTNTQGIVVDYNESALKLLEKKTLLNERIDTILLQIHESIIVDFYTLSFNEKSRKVYTFKVKKYEQEDFYKKIVENCYDEIFVTNIYGKTIYTNPVFEKYYGISRKEVINSDSDFLTANKFISTSPTYASIEKKRVATTRVETNTNKRLLTTTKPVFKTNGQIDFIVGISRDIDELNNTVEDPSYHINLYDKYKNSNKSTPKKRVKNENSFIYLSKSMHSLMETIDVVSKVDSTVLITGESGTGKTKIAEQIHIKSNRKKKPFITIDCSTISENLIESELFGYVPGAFTGALKSGKKGLVETADGGTLFLDEIGNLSVALQAKLLLFLQNHRFTPIGSIKTHTADVRIITATNINLLEQIEAGSFREDLYYRLNVIQLKVPPLRKRTEDIIPLVSHFLTFFNKKYNLEHIMSQAATDKLKHYTWPGNIRELENLIERIVVITTEYIIEPEHLPDYVLKKQMQNMQYPLNYVEKLDEFQAEIIKNAYFKFKNTYKMAEMLNLTQSKVMRLIKKYIY